MTHTAIDYTWRVESINLDYRNDGMTESWEVRGELTVGPLLYKTLTVYESDSGDGMDEDVIYLDGEEVDVTEHQPFGGIDFTAVIHEQAMNALNPIWLARNAVTEQVITATLGTMVHSVAVSG